jgi:hypothetical protein
MPATSSYFMIASKHAMKALRATFEACDLWTKFLLSRMKKKEEKLHV